MVCYCYRFLCPGPESPTAAAAAEGPPAAAAVTATWPLATFRRGHRFARRASLVTDMTWWLM